MPATKKVLFIGNRSAVFREIAGLPDLALSRVFAVQDSYLHRELAQAGQPCVAFRSAEKQSILDQIAAADFDLLVSNGCPFVLPISKLRRPGQLFLNIHPAPLPEGRGRHPVNGAVLYRTGFIGATLHYMDDGVDTGNIVHQDQIAITPDLDLGLLYRLSFALEGRIFRAGMLRLAAASYVLEGTRQTSAGSYYSRKAEDQVVRLGEMSDEEILRRVAAFGIRSQGVQCATSGGAFRVFDAEAVTHPVLREDYAGRAPGEILLRYEDRMLVKSRDGIIKFKAFQPLAEPTAERKSA